MHFNKVSPEMEMMPLMTKMMMMKMSAVSLYLVQLSRFIIENRS